MRVGHLHQWQVLLDELPHVPDVRRQRHVCTATCMNPNGCVSGLCSGTIPCSGLVAGWKNGNECHRYSSDPNNFCLPSGDCSTSASTSLCDNPPTALATQIIGTTPRTECDGGCRDTSKCPINGAVTTSDSISEICFTSLNQTCTMGAQCNLQGKCVPPGASCTIDNDCPVAAPRCSGPATGFKVCCQDVMGGWNHPCQTCTNGIPTFICPGTSTTGCAEPTFPTSSAVHDCDRLQQPRQGLERRRVREVHRQHWRQVQTAGPVLGANDYALCTSAVTTAFQCASSLCATRPSASSATLRRRRSAPCALSTPRPARARRTRSARRRRLQEDSRPDVQCWQRVLEHVLPAGRVLQCGVVRRHRRRWRRVPSLRSRRLGRHVHGRRRCGVRRRNAIACSTLVSGFSTRFCQKFSADTTGLCDNTGTCIKTDTNRCITNGVTSTNARDVRHVKCIDSAAVPVAHAACRLDAGERVQAQHRRERCADIQCSNFVRGWAGNACQLYGASPRIGRCDGTARASAARARRRSPRFACRRRLCRRARAPRASTRCVRCQLGAVDGRHAGPGVPRQRRHRRLH
jgi:hypothetical protein